MSRLVAADAAGVALAAAALRAGQLVVFPTETVYGLGANALDAQALRAVYAAKGRPADNPLIVHCVDTAACRRLAAAWPQAAQSLADAFWPGPLTLVLPRARPDTDAVAGALATVALRVPAHPVARQILAAAGVPVAAPSANRSGRPSPTRVADARADLGDAVAVYVDGGPTDVGLESTVVSLATAQPTMLRLGGIPLAELERVVGPVAVATRAGTGPAAAPGMKYRHYAPRAPVRVLPAEFPCNWDAGAHAGAAYVVSRESAAVLGLRGEGVRVPGARSDAAAWGRDLYAALRDLDTPGRPVIYVEAIPEDGLGASVMDRVRRAAEGANGPSGPDRQA